MPVCSPEQKELEADPDGQNDLDIKANPTGNRAREGVGEKQSRNSKRKSSQHSNASNAVNSPNNLKKMTPKLISDADKKIIPRGLSPELLLAQQREAAQYKDHINLGV